MDRDLDNSESGREKSGRQECPDPTVWYEIAGGVMEPEQAEQHFHHISGCGACGALLRQAVADLEEETTAPEAKQIAALESGRPEWQRRLAQRIAGTITADKGSIPWWSRWKLPRLALVAAGLLVIVVLGEKLQLRVAQKLVASAYSDQRTLAMRMSGAGYATFKAERGATESLVDRPVKLLLAEALIRSRLGSHSDDSYWLHTKAQADLLDGKYDAAEQSLNRARQISPKSVDILTDLATANFQKGDYSESFELLSQVLSLKADDPVALFNRALVAEHLFLFRQSLDDWERYLKVDAGSQWANEAREAAARVRKQVNDHDRSRVVPLLSPAQVAMSVNGPDVSPPEMDERVEEYLDEAVRSWLPMAYSETSSDPVARQALFFLADLTARQHHDQWLSDLLQNSKSPAFSGAIVALARAVQGNANGNYDGAVKEASRAAALFNASGNVAGRLRSQFEQAYSLQLLRKGSDCRRQASVVLSESERYPYPWLQIQLGLEKSICAGLMGDMGTEQSVGAVALNRAETSAYRVLSLRALGFHADHQFDTGDPSAAWDLTIGGLSRYWSQQFPPMRGYSLYVELAYIAEAVGRPNLQLASMSEAVALIDSDPDLSLRAVAHASVANAGVAAAHPEIAEQQFAEAARLYSMAPQTDATRDGRIEIEIQMALLDARQGRFDPAFMRLTTVQSEILRLTDHFLQLEFYPILGEVQLRRGHAMEAEPALRSAMTLAEEKLSSLHTEKDRISWSKDVRSIYLDMAEAQLVQGREQESLETFEWYLGAAQGVARIQVRAEGAKAAENLSTLSSRLPLLTEETVVAYGLLADGLAIWVYDNRGVTARWIPSPTQDLQELAGRFYDLSSDRHSDMNALRRDARNLYQLLITPVEDRLAPGRTLVFEQEGVLARVPLEALLGPDGHYLVERTPIVHSLGRYSDERLHEDGNILATLPALIVASAASSQAEGLIPLPDVTAEADTVAGNFRSPQVLKGREATLEAVKSDLPAAAIFHFAGHSLSTPDRAGLMLAGDDKGADSSLLLDADGLRRLKLQHLQIAVLSACSTASGGGGSRGFTSVTEGFLRAGVPHVVASRWAVDSVETRGFFEDYYRNLLSGIPISQVTRLTSRKMLANSATSHPYYWSAFAAYGRP